MDGSTGETLSIVVYDRRTTGTTVGKRPPFATSSHVSVIVTLAGCVGAGVGSDLGHDQVGVGVGVGANGAGSLLLHPSSMTAATIASTACLISRASDTSCLSAVGHQDGRESDMCQHK